MPQNNSASELRDNLISIENIKGDIRNSIANKGQNIDINTPFAEYSNLISNITTSENLDTVLNSQEQKLEELESALSGKTSDISYINFNAIVRPGLGGGGAVGSIFKSSYIETLPFWNFGFNPNYRLTLNNSFSDCNNLRTIPNWNIYSITSFEYTFANCYNLQNVPNWDMSNVTGIVGMFSHCNNLKTVPNWNTSKITNMSCAFVNCSNLQNVPNWDMSNVTNMSSMFHNCKHLESIPNWNTSKVINMSNAFSLCSNLVSISNLDTSNVTNIVYLFYFCGRLETVPNLNTSKVTNMSSLFTGCTNLVNAPYLDMSKTNSIIGMFSNCTNLVNVPQYNTSNLQSLALMGTFTGCNNLSDASIQNIINMCLTASLVNNPTFKNLNVSCSYSPFNNTNIMNTRYQNRWAELDAAGWAY